MAQFEIDGLPINSMVDLSHGYVKKPDGIHFLQKIGWR